MSRLRHDEVAYLHRVLNISAENLAKLSEEESDINLLIELASQDHALTKETLFSFSPLFAFKLLTFRYSKPYPFEHGEKLYVASAIDESYGKLLSGLINGSSAKTIDAFLQVKPTQETSKSILVASGLLNARLPVDLNSKNHIYSIEDGFRMSGLRELATHIPDWIIILRKIQHDGWLMENKPKQLPPPSKVKIV